jgi:hypothetical protein
VISYSINVFLQQTCDFWHAIEAVDLDYTIICPRNDYDAVRCAVGLRYGTVPVRLYVVAREPMQYRCVIEGYPLARSSLRTHLSSSSSVSSRFLVSVAITVVAFFEVVWLHIVPAAAAPVKVHSLSGHCYHCLPTIRAS